jgi:hypothetical protein
VHNGGSRGGEGRLYECLPRCRCVIYSVTYVSSWYLGQTWAGGQSAGENGARASIQNLSSCSCLERHVWRFLAPPPRKWTARCYGKPKASQTGGERQRSAAPACPLTCRATHEQTGGGELSSREVEGSRECLVSARNRLSQLYCMAGVWRGGAVTHRPLVRKCTIDRDALSPWAAAHKLPMLFSAPTELVHYKRK